MFAGQVMTRPSSARVAEGERLMQSLQQPAPGPDHLQQPAAAVMILGMKPEMIGERVDPLGEEGDLHFGRPGVLLVGLVLGCGALLVEAHASGPLIIVSCRNPL